MRYRRSIVGSALLLSFLLAGGPDWIHGQQIGGKTIKLKLLLPLSDSKFYLDPQVHVDGKEVLGKGDVRTLTVTTAKDKDYVDLMVYWEPNNYTKIWRPRKVTAKEGEVVVDFREKSEAEKDEIKVRWVPTPDNFVDAMCQMAKVNKNDVVYDLGCGDGVMVVRAVKFFNAKRGVGIDLDPDMIKRSKEKAKEFGVSDKVEFRVGDVLKVEDLSDATVVLLYMGDYINQRLKPILKSTLKPSSRVVSHRFLMGDDWPPEQSKKLTSTDNPSYTESIHMWTIKKQ